MIFGGHGHTFEMALAYTGHAEMCQKIHIRRHKKTMNLLLDSVENTMDTVEEIYLLSLLPFSFWKFEIVFPLSLEDICKNDRP